jgi:hypothetical protein
VHRCVMVQTVVNSRYVKDEATFALKRSKLVPVSIEEVVLPFRFEGLHTLSFIAWDGSKDFSEYRRLVRDIAAIVGPPATKRQTAQPADRQQTIAVLDKQGRFKDIQTYKRAHGQDIKRRSKREK